MARRWGETSPVEEVVFIYTTWPDAETADAAALEAVERGLAACANRFAPVRATYRWEGRIETGEETPLTFKTTAARAPALKALILERHPYDLPAILALPVSAELSHGAFVEWIAGNSAPSGGSPREAGEGG